MNSKTALVTLIITNLLCVAALVTVLIARDNEIGAAKRSQLELYANNVQPRRGTFAFVDAETGIKIEIKGDVIVSKVPQ